MSRRNTPEVFWSRVQIGKPDECWPWTGRVKPPTKAFPVGHGVYDHDGTWDYAHRYAWYLTYGAYTENWCLHHCDNPPCCNPAHLYDGTPQDNIRDRDARGRRNVKGERHPRAKLTQADVDYIRKNYVRYARGTENSGPALARRFNVDNSTIHLVLKGHNWHVQRDAMQERPMHD